MELTDRAKGEVAARMQETAEERRQTKQHLVNGTLLDANSDERIEKRKVKLLANAGYSDLLDQPMREALAGKAVRDTPPEVQRAFERTIDGRDTQPCWFLTRGAELRRTIGRIHIRDANRRVGWGTGFLVAPNLLLTNQHVLASAATAGFSRVEFDYEETFAGEFLPSATFDLAPDVLFVCDPADGGLDYALVAVAPQARPEGQRAGMALAEFGHNVLVREEGKLLKGELIHAIHHPEGQPRQVSLRDNRLTALPEHWLHYETDTEEGSSGAPLFNNQWQVVGVHHAGVEQRDAEGHILAIGGARWTAAMGERQKWWAANEGLRISRFVADVEQKVQAAIDAGAAPTAECVVTEAGHTLFGAMLRPSQQRPIPENVVVVAAGVGAGARTEGGTAVVVAPQRRTFNPD